MNDLRGIYQRLAAAGAKFGFGGNVEGFALSFSLHNVFRQVHICGTWTVGLCRPEGIRHHLADRFRRSHLGTELCYGLQERDGLQGLVNLLKTLGGGDGSTEGHHPLRVVAELQKWLADDVTLCLDMGSFHLWIAHFLFSFRARQILISNGQQTLGVALPWGIASCLVRPNEKTLSISGDGGFLFSAMELETAVRLKLNLVHMVWINGTYDMVAVQEQPKYKRTSGVDFGPVDVVKYAEAFGAAGFMVDAPDQIGPTLKKAFEISGPVLIGIRVDYRDNHKLFERVHEHLLN